MSRYQRIADVTKKLQTKLADHLAGPLGSLLPRGQCRAPAGEVVRRLIAQQVAPYRPGRIEPRVRKRRPT